MSNNKRGVLPTLIFLFLSFTAPLIAEDGLENRPPSKLESVFQTAVSNGQLLGAQIEIGNADGPVTSKSFGYLSAKKKTPVNDETMFLVASVTKPLVAASVMRLVDADQMVLDDSIDKWIAEFASAKVKEGDKATRAPTIRELMTHRAGIYSNAQDIREGVWAHRDFRLSLTESAERISRQPFFSQPGEQFAYGNASYCVLGRCVELASKAEYQEVFDTQVCKPLGLKHTTFFPTDFDSDVALPGIATLESFSVNATPWKYQFRLGDRLRLAHTGTGLYSTASDLGVFARMILNNGRVNGKQYLTEDSWNEMSRQQYPKGNYGLGWKLAVKDGVVVGIGHDGEWEGYRSLLLVDLVRKTYKVGLYTLPTLTAKPPPEISKAFAN